MTAGEILLDELRHARTSRRHSQEEFGKIINYSGTHVSAVETGARHPTSSYVAAIDSALKTSGIYLRLLERLSDLNGEPLWLQAWITFEQQARALRWYEVAWVPGMLQVEAYARAIFGRDGSLDAAEVVERPAEVAALREQWESTLAEALTLNQSTELMMEVAKTWT